MSYYNSEWEIGYSENKFLLGQSSSLTLELNHEDFSHLEIWSILPAAGSQDSKKNNLGVTEVVEVPKERGRNKKQPWPILGPETG